MRETYTYREFVANQYIRWNVSGLEIGALNRPLWLAGSVVKKKVDRMSNTDLDEQYPEMGSHERVRVDIVDDGQHLSTIGDETQDFVVANHFIEHVENPILTIRNMLRVLRTNGILFMAIPDLRYINDKDRPPAQYDHILKDYENDATATRAHYEEYVKYIQKIEDPKKAVEQVDKLIRDHNTIHFHSWTQRELMELFVKIRELPGFNFEVEHISKNGAEMVFVLRKS
jgi:predicted SAM-dependent methyltransferase